MFKLCFLLCSSLYAQSNQEQRLRQLQLEQEQNDAIVEQDKAKSRAIAFKQQEFYDKAQHLTTLWNEFSHELNTKGTFNANLAKQISDAFHDLERCDGWVTTKRKR